VDVPDRMVGLMIENPQGETTRWAVDAMPDAA